MSSELYHRALGYAACAHRKQVRKYTGERYVNHPVRVADSLKLAGLPEFVQAAALLHDTIEDCGVTFLEIADEFNLNIATLVLQVTDCFTKEAYPWKNRAARKEMELVRLSHIHHYAQSIKVADLIDNTSDIAKHDKGFAKVYLREKRDLLNVLTEANPQLVRHADAQIKELSHGLW